MMEPVTAGLVRLTIHRAEKLEKKDITGKSDPYLVVSYNHSRVGQTKVCKKSLEPVWEEEFTLHITEDGPEMIELELYDKDKMGKDETMGFLAIDVRRIKKYDRLSETWSKLQSCKSGHLLWSAEWEEESPQDTEPAPVTRAEDQPTPPQPPQPVEEAIIVADPQSEAVSDLKPVSVKDPEPSQPVSEPEPEQVKTEDLGVVRAGFLKVTVHSAEDLIAKDLGGKSDPYVVIRYDGQKTKSKHVKNDLNPEFEFTTGYVTEDGGPSELLIELKDHDIGKDESLGSCSFDLRRVMMNNIQEVWTDLVGVKKGKVLVSLNFDGSGSNDAPEENIEMTMEEKKTISDDTSGLRQRNLAIKGRVRLNILYDTNKEELKLFLHEAQNLPGGDLPDPPDPQVKVYMMPGKRKKKKSDVVKDSVNPTFNEEFDFSIDFKDLPNHWLKVRPTFKKIYTLLNLSFPFQLSVVDKKGVFSKSPVLGSVVIQLDDPGLQTGVAGWFPLDELDEDSD